MFEDLSKALTKFKNSKSIVLFTPTINMVDKAASIIALSKVCLKQGKEFKVICPQEPPQSIKDMLYIEGVEVLKEPKSKEYVVSVDYSKAKIEKVVCKRDEDTRKLNFIITPGDDLFDFKNVELISGGSSFDLMFSLGVKELSKVDEKYKELFNVAPVISITKKETDIGDYKFLINGHKSYSEVIYEFLKSFSTDLSEDVLNYLLQGIVTRYRLFEGGDNNGWLIVANLVKFGADFNKVMKSLYYSKDLANLQLQMKVMENVKIDKNARVIWSEVFTREVQLSNVDLRGKIIFNISRDFDLAFVVYNIDENHVNVVVESNDTDRYSALKIAQVFDGYGSSSRAAFSYKGADFLPRFFSELDTIYGLRVNYS
jgi:hypothetical protein